MAVMWGWYPGHGGAKKCLRAGVLRARIGVEKFLQVGMVPTFHAPHFTILFSSPSSRGRYLVLGPHLSIQSDLCTCCGAGGAGELRRSPSLACWPGCQRWELCAWLGKRNREGWRWAVSGTGWPCESCFLCPALQPILPNSVVPP